MMATSLICTACGYDKNPTDSQFCDACGSELPQQTVSVTPEYSPIIEPSVEPEVMQAPPPLPVLPPPDPFSQNTATTTARLIARQPNAPATEFPIDGGTTTMIGIFDPDMGPVEMDLRDFQGGDTVSRNHAEIYQESGVWKVKDLGSTNGTFIKPAGQSRYGARITMPQSLNSGDEVAFAQVRFLFQSP